MSMASVLLERVEVWGVATTIRDDEHFFLGKNGTKPPESRRFYNLKLILLGVEQRKVAYHRKNRVSVFSNFQPLKTLASIVSG